MIVFKMVSIRQDSNNKLVPHCISDILHALALLPTTVGYKWIWNFHLDVFSVDVVYTMYPRHGFTHKYRNRLQDILSMHFFLHYAMQTRPHQNVNGPKPYIYETLNTFLLAVSHQHVQANYASLETTYVQHTVLQKKIKNEILQINNFKKPLIQGNKQVQ